MDWASPEKVECLCFSDSQEDEEIGARKKHHQDAVLDERSQGGDHQSTKEDRPWRGDRMCIQMKNWKS
jgi:hypothetical protein